MRKLHLGPVIVALAFLVSPLAAQRGFLTVTENLPGLVRSAGIIVEGYVIARRVEPHPDFPNLYTLVVTVHVNDVLKGQAGQTFTFRQYIVDIRDRMDSAGYRKGQHVLLMVTDPSRYGLSSTVGVEQGRFRIRTGNDGSEWAQNGHANEGLLKGMDVNQQVIRGELEQHVGDLVQDHQAGAIALSDLKRLIRFLAEED